MLACGAVYVGRDFSPGVSAQAPQFKTGVDAITLNVAVLDKDRKPVRGLRQEDFTIIEDGKPQRIVSFSEEAIATEWKPGPVWRHNFSPDVATNGADARRLVVILMSYRIGADPWAVQKAKEVAHAIIDRLSPADLASVVWQHRSGDAQGLTADQAKLHVAVERMRPGRPNGASRCAVENLVDVLAGFPEKRKLIIQITEPKDVEVKKPGGGIGSATSGPLAIAEPRPYVKCSSSTLPFAAQAQRANVVMYTVDSNGLLAASSVDDDENPTGGRSIRNTNAPERFVGGIFDENSSFYLVAYESNSPKPPQGFRRLEVKVNRPGVSVHAPKNWYSKELTAKELRNPRKVPTPLMKAITEVLPDADVPLRAVAASFADTTGKSTATVAVTLGVTLPGEKRGNAIQESLDVQVQAYDLEGKLHGTAKKTVGVALRADGSDGHLDVLSRMNLKPDRYELRISMSSAALKETASVYVDALVPDFFKDALSLSGIALSAEPAVMAAPKDELASLLPIVPTTQREFGGKDAAQVFMRIYQKKNAAAVSIVAEIRDAADKVVVRDEQAIAATNFGANRAADFQWKLPLDKLAAGEHLVTLTANVGAATAQRSLQIVKR
jgi:VWFA-related protein